VQTPGVRAKPAAPWCAARAAGEDGLAAFEFLMQAGARYNSQAWKALGALPPAPPPPRGADPPPPLGRGLRGDLFGRPR